MHEEFWNGLLDVRWEDAPLGPETTRLVLRLRECGLAERACRDYGHAVIHPGRVPREETGGDRALPGPCPRTGGRKPLARPAGHHPVARRPISAEKLCEAEPPASRSFKPDGDGGPCSVPHNLRLHITREMLSSTFQVVGIPADPW